MCIKEVLRMYPLAVMFNKMSAEEIVTDEFRIPKGMLHNYSTVDSTIMLCHILPRLFMMCYVLTNNLPYILTIVLPGTWVGIGIYFLHHNPAIWSDPEVSLVLTHAP